MRRDNKFFAFYFCNLKFLYKLQFITQDACAVKQTIQKYTTIHVCLYNNTL